jgi:hypothetical protein
MLPLRMRLLESILIFLNIVSVASDCFDRNVAECTADPTCSTYPGTCGPRTWNGCDTSSLTCRANSNCAAVANALFLNPTTCSKCADICTTLTGQSTCETNPKCQWNPERCDDRVPCSNALFTTKEACLSESGCHWYSWSVLQCGSSSVVSFCGQCQEGENPSEPMLLFRSAMQNSIGKTCTWDLASSKSQQARGKTLRIKVVAAANTCENTLAPDTKRDEANIALGLLAGGSISSPIPLSCVSSPPSSPRPTRKPTRTPTSRPTRRPTDVPTRKPTKTPTSRPTRRPTLEPTRRPSRMPSASAGR